MTSHQKCVWIITNRVHNSVKMVCVSVQSTIFKTLLFTNKVKYRGPFQSCGDHSLSRFPQDLVQTIHFYGPRRIQNIAVLLFGFPKLTSSAVKVWTFMKSMGEHSRPQAKEQGFLFCNWGFKLFPVFSQLFQIVDCVHLHTGLILRCCEGKAVSF